MRRRLYAIAAMGVIGILATIVHLALAPRVTEALAWAGVHCMFGVACVVPIALVAAVEHREPDASSSARLAVAVGLCQLVAGLWAFAVAQQLADAMAVGASGTAWASGGVVRALWAHRFLARISRGRSTGLVIEAQPHGSVAAAQSTADGTVPWSRYAAPAVLLAVRELNVGAFRDSSSREPLATFGRPGHGAGDAGRRAALLCFALVFGALGGALAMLAVSSMDDGGESPWRGPGPYEHYGALVTALLSLVVVAVGTRREPSQWHVDTANAAAVAGFCNSGVLLLPLAATLPPLYALASIGLACVLGVIVSFPCTLMIGGPLAWAAHRAARAEGAGLRAASSAAARTIACLLPFLALPLTAPMTGPWIAPYLAVGALAAALAFLVSWIAPRRHASSSDRQEPTKDAALRGRGPD